MVAKRSEHLWPLTGECPDLNAAVTRASGCVGTSGCASGCASGCVGTVDALENRCSSIKLAGNTFLLDRGLVDAFLMGTWKVPGRIYCNLIITTASVCMTNSICYGAPPKNSKSVEDGRGGIQEGA